jgi:hypothetical protein
MYVPPPPPPPPPALSAPAAAVAVRADDLSASDAPVTGTDIEQIGAETNRSRIVHTDQPGTGQASARVSQLPAGARPLRSDPTTGSGDPALQRQAGSIPSSVPPEVLGAWQAIVDRGGSPTPEAIVSQLGPDVTTQLFGSATIPASVAASLGTVPGAGTAIPGITGLPGGLTQLPTTPK